MRNYQRVCSYHKPSILFCHTINQNTFTRKDGCALHTAANSDTPAWRLADFLHLLPSTYNKHTKAPIRVELYIPLVTFDINEGWRGRSFWDRWSSGSGLAFWGGLVQRMPVVARLVYNLDHTDSGNPGSLLKKLCWMYIPFGRCDESIVTILGGVNIYRRNPAKIKQLYNLVSVPVHQPVCTALLGTRVHGRTNTGSSF